MYVLYFACLRRIWLACYAGSSELPGPCGSGRATRHVCPLRRKYIVSASAAACLKYRHYVPKHAVILAGKLLPSPCELPGLDFLAFEIAHFFTIKSAPSPQPKAPPNVLKFQLLAVPIALCPAPALR